MPVPLHTVQRRLDCSRLRKVLASEAGAVHGVLLLITRPASYQCHSINLQEGCTVHVALGTALRAHSAVTGQQDNKRTRY